MTQDQKKVIRAKVGLLELAKQLGSVSQACKVSAMMPTTSLTMSDQIQTFPPQRYCIARRDEELVGTFLLRVRVIR